MRHPAIVLATVGLTVTTGWGGVGTTWHVDDDAPDDPGPGTPLISDPLEDGTPEHPFDAIQEAIDASSDGDVVLIQNGTYCDDGNYDLDFGGREIAVTSAFGPAACIIDVENGADRRGFLFRSGETRLARLEGVTIVNTRLLIPDARGGGVLCEGSSPTIVSCRFLDNSVGEFLCFAPCIARGGGIHVDGGGPLIRGCVFDGNLTTSIDLAEGGGLYAVNTTGLEVIDCRFEANEVLGLTITDYYYSMIANSYGGGAYVDASCVDTTFVNCLFARNEAQHGGPGGVGIGGALYNAGAGTVLVNCTLADNGAADAGDGIGSGPGDLAVHNGILRNNDWTGNPVFTYTLADTAASGPGNIAGNPRFLAPASGDYRLSECSPAIDAGSNDAVPRGITTDLGGGLRFRDDPATPDTGQGRPPLVDMGAYELFCAEPCPCTCLADVNDDGAVNGIDLDFVLIGWGLIGSSPADVNGDLIVDVDDLVAVIVGWGACP